MKENVVLLVDADADSEGCVTEAAARTGHGTLLAETSREAFRVLANQIWRLDLVVVDVDPGAHGMALLEAISGCADRPPIVVITALEETYMEPIARKHGATHCLGKPLTTEKLASVLKKASAGRSLTSDRWGSLVPPPAKKSRNLKVAFRGIAGKLSPSPPRRRKES